MFRKLALAGAMALAFAFATPANAAICPASLLSTVVGVNPVALQTFIEKICTNLDTLATGSASAANQTAVQDTHNSIVGVRTYLADPADGSAVSMTNPVQIYISNPYLNVAAGTATTLVKSGPGTFASIIINTKGASANTLTCYDNTAGSGTKIATIDTTTAVPTLTYNLAFGTGLTCVSATGTGADYTVTYR